MGCAANLASRRYVKEPLLLDSAPSKQCRLRNTLSGSTHTLNDVLSGKEVQAFSDGVEAAGGDEDVEAAWEGVQEVVLCYAPRDAAHSEGFDEVADAFRPRDRAQASSLPPWLAGVSTTARSGDELSGPPLNTASAYGLLLGWVHDQKELKPARRCIFDPCRLLDMKDRALQFAELDGLLASSFDESQQLHRQLAFSVYYKFAKLYDAGLRPAVCPRHGPHWEAMGFQGQDFSTDLRGVGIVGLLHLLCFFSSFSETARRLFGCNSQRESKFGDNGSVPVACASLNFSSLAVLALREGRLSGICRQAKSVHAGVLKVHAALMFAFVREFCSRPDATVLTFGEILQGLRQRVHAAPSRLLQDLLKQASPAERAAAERYVMVRPLPQERTPQPPPSSLTAGEVLEVVRSGGSKRFGSPQAPGRPGDPEAYRPAMLARASSTSPLTEVEAVFRVICNSPATAPAEGLMATPEDLRFFLCFTLGCEAVEVERFVQRVDVNTDGQVSLEEFHRGFRLLNSHRISRRQYESFVRRPGSIKGEQFAIEDLTGCEVHVFDRVACCTVDGCTASEILVGPSEASVFVRDCEDCCLYVAAQQLRTRRCKNCKFFLFSATEPIIEMSSNLHFAPLALAYPGLAEQMEQAGLDPARNFWNAIFDFSSPDDCHLNWSVVSPSECKQYRFLLESSGELLTAADASIFPATTLERLRAEPLQSGLDAGSRVDTGGLT